MIRSNLFLCQILEGFVAEAGGKQLYMNLRARRLKPENVWVAICLKILDWHIIQVFSAGVVKLGISVQ